MEKTQYFTAILKDAMGAFPRNTAVFEDAFKTSVSLNEKLSHVTLDAAEKSAEISYIWKKDTIAKLTEASKAKTEPADYAKAATDFFAGATEVATEKMFAFAEIAKKAQIDTVELLMGAGTNITEETAAAKKSTNEVAATAKKAAATQCGTRAQN